MADNLSIWEALKRTDPSHTKPFKRAGGFKGTAVKPIYSIERMTEQFGPWGKGWGVEKPDYQLVPGEHKELLVFCTVEVWWMDGPNRHSGYGVGGDKVITHIKEATFKDDYTGEEKTRPERWENDDEAFKKAFTDALSNAMKHLGMSADIHMGQFDDSKYVRELREEFAEDKKEEKKTSAGSTPFDTANPPPTPTPTPAPKSEKMDFWKKTSLDLDPKREKTLEQFAASMKSAIAATPDEKSHNKLIRDNDTRLDQLCVEMRELGNEVLELSKLRLGALMAA